MGERKCLNRKPSSGQFPLQDAPVVNNGICKNYLGLDICFHEYKYYDSLQVRLIQELAIVRGHLRE